jgi:outer membrane immunogenic protein
MKSQINEIKKNKLQSLSKKFILLVAFGLFSNGVFAQSPLEEGRTQLNAGLGTSSWGVPVYFGLDYGIAKDFTLGGQISFQSDDYNDNNNNYKQSSVGLGANGNYHFNSLLNIPSKFDFYAGASLTYFFWNYDSNNHPDNTSVGLGLQVGGRYFFTNKFGVNLELGGGTGISGAKVGVTIKL